MFIFLQADRVKAPVAFNLERDQGADEYEKQLILMGASNVTIACYKIGMAEDEKVPIHYYSKSGSNLEEYLTFIDLLLDKDEIKYDTFNKSGKRRNLNLAVWLTLNDVGRLYMDARAKYLGNMLIKISARVDKFYEETKRYTRLSFIPYMYAPQMSEHHATIDTFNAYVRNFNKTALGSHTYDINTLLMRVPKPGEATNARINKQAFISSDACWRMQGNLVTHLSNYKMAESCRTSGSFSMTTSTRTRPHQLLKGNQKCS